MKLFDRRTRRQPLFPAILILAALMLLVPACKSPTSPEGGEADIVVSNRYGESLDITMNGTFLFTVTNLSGIEVDDVAMGDYLLEARTAAGVLVEETTISVTEKQDYVWELAKRGDVIVENRSGIKLNIYLNATLQFEMEDGEDKTIERVPFGEYLLAALNAEDNTEYATQTLTIDEEKVYTWTIDPAE